MAKNMLKRNLLTSIVATALSASMLVGTTFAWFTDSVTSNNNVIQTGNLDVELYYQNDKTTEKWTKDTWEAVGKDTNVFKANTLWEPGHVEVVKLKVVNEGTLALKYQLGVNIVNETGSTNVYDEPFKVSEFIKYGVVGGDQTYTREQAVTEAEKVATPLATAYNSGTTMLEAASESTTDDEKIVTMVVYMPESVGNDANAKKGAAVPTIQLGINVFATQVSAEEDSFDNKYDDGAYILPVVNSAAELQSALEQGQSVKLGNDMNLDETIVIPAPATSTYVKRAAAPAQVIDLNGKTLSTAYAEGSTTNHLYAFENYGNIVITNGTINARGIHNYGKLTLESGTINAIDGNGGYAVLNYKSASFVMNGGTVATTLEDDNKVADGGYDATTVRVENGASFVMNNGKINNICDFTLGIDNHGETTINGGEITTVHSSIGTSNNLTVNGGTITCNGLEGITAHALWASAGTTTINGGTFNGKDNYNGFNVDASAGAIVNIYGGNFLPVHSGSLYGEGTITVKGGIFFDDVSARVASGYKAIDNGNGTWSVKTDTTEFVTEGLYKDGNVYYIENANGLKYLGEKAMTGNNNTAETVIYELKANMDLNGADFSAMVAQRGDTLIFNGNGYTISNANVISGNNDNTTGMAAMFYCYPNSSLNISNLTLKDLVVTSEENGTGYAGAVIGYCEGAAVLNNVDVINAVITGAKSSGALVGHMSGSLTAKDCDVSATVTITDYEANGHYAGKYVGTIAGAAKFDDCFANVTIGGKLHAKNDGDIYGRVTEAATLIVDGDDALNTIKIGTLQELIDFANDVNVNGNGYSGKTVVLTANIDLNNMEWTPIGQTGGNGVATYFQGTFDGKGYTISNLKITDNAYDEGKHYAAGFFGFIDGAEATIKNLKINGAVVNGHHWTGVIAGYLSGKIIDCTVENATVNCTHANNDACGDKAGVIVGYVNQGTVTGNTVKDCTVTAGRDAGQVVGAAKTTQAYGNTISNVTVKAAGDCTGANIRNEEIGRVID